MEKTKLGKSSILPLRNHNSLNTKEEVRERAIRDIEENFNSLKGDLKGDLKGSVAPAPKGKKR